MRAPKASEAKCGNQLSINTLILLSQDGGQGNSKTNNNSPVETRCFASQFRVSTDKNEMPETICQKRYARDEMPETKCQRRYARDEMPETKCQRRNARDEMPETKCQRREASRLYGQYKNAINNS
ncbi:MAG TPA: hypothetical protein ENF37_00800 [Beggiatoa sp.]|nr:hypothetical protein [Beggiatoa sp.]